jgi:hypothetical protein
MLLDMDGTITPERYVVELARATGHEAALAKLLDGGDDAATRSERIAALFKFVHQQQFERVAQALPIRPGVVACVNRCGVPASWWAWSATAISWRGNPAAPDLCRLRAGPHHAVRCRGLLGRGAPEPGLSGAGR